MNNSTTITPTPDVSVDGKGTQTRYVGPRWIQDLARQIVPLLKAPTPFLKVLMPDIAFTTLFDWVTFVSMLDVVLRLPELREIGIDFISHQQFALLPRQDLLHHRSSPADHRPVEYGFSDRVYTFHGFIESLGTKAVLARQGGPTLLYSNLPTGSADFRRWFTGKMDGAATVVLGLTRIDSKASCKQFLDAARILDWKNQMADRFRCSPLFEFDEVWRVLCHELAVNIYEHAGSNGFIAARVVEPLTADGRLRTWCGRTYDSSIRSMFAKMPQGFLELCISDYGVGFGKTLAKAFSKNADVHPQRWAVPDLLAFAFDELGTCKSEDECWLTERHALGRILMLVAKYGGALTLQSAGGQVRYLAHGGPFKRRRGHTGYDPTMSTILAASMRGAQIQLILPLVPITQVRPGARRDSALNAVLPSSFRVDPQHPRGHIVTLSQELDLSEAAAGAKEQRDFRKACQALCLKLSLRSPRGEPLVLDFDGIQWSAAQFETLLHLLQNLLQTTPILLVGIPAALAREVVALEHSSARTYLRETLQPTELSAIGKAYAEHSEDAFLETYRRVHCAVLALDTDGEKYIFGLPDEHAERAFLSLIDPPGGKRRSIEVFVRESGVAESLARAVLTNTSTLFQSAADGWVCVWGQEELDRQANRALLKNFDRVVTKSKAWRGEATSATGESSRERFHLPWQDTQSWVANFFDSSRVLSRGRYADEAGQALIYRLKKYLESHGESLHGVSVLACVTAPAVLLASAMHRWWPVEEGYHRPSIADLGEYLLLHPGEHLPVTSAAGGVVLVQDLLSRGEMSGELIRRLKTQGNTVLCLLALVRLVDQEIPTQVCRLDDWDEDPVRRTPRHALIRMKRPPICDSPEIGADDRDHYWIEPRTLRAIPYPALRRRQSNLSDASPANEVTISSARNRDGTSILRSGHYVYGTRHYSLAIDIRSALDGPLGDAVAASVADICEGTAAVPVPPGRPLSPQFQGDVTAVLLPLHSQIQYLWPKIELLLAQRGRRQHVWLLDATLFLGSGPAYKLPLQFTTLLESVIKDCSHGERERRLRLLILDDAIVSSRTLVTILDAIERETKIAFRQARVSPSAKTQPIQWIRVQSVFNQLGYAQNRHWRALRAVGAEHPVPFLFEDYVQCPGLPVYEEASCPQCAKLRRLRQLTAEATRLCLEEVQGWLREERDNLEPVAMDAPKSNDTPPRRLSQPIEVIAPLSGVPSGDGLDFADAAIAVFHELMYRSCPPQDILRQLDVYLSQPIITADENEHQRYRWAVYDWCIREWPRMQAQGARTSFIGCLRREMARNSSLLVRVCEELGGLYSDQYVDGFILEMFDALEALDHRRSGASDSKQQTADLQDRAERARGLYVALHLFLLNKGPEAVARSGVRLPNIRSESTLLQGLKLRADRVGEFTLGYTRLLYLRHSRDERPADPRTALSYIAGTLFRGQDPAIPGSGGHRLLLRLAKEVLDTPAATESQTLLQASLGLFVAGLRALEPYFGEQSVKKQLSVLRRANQVLRGLEPTSAREPAPQVLRVLGQLSDELAPGAAFCDSFNRIFHPEVRELGQYLDGRQDEENRNCAPSGASLVFKYVTEGVDTCRILCHSERLRLALSNWTIEPLRTHPGEHKSSIVVSKHRRAGSAPVLRFRLLTSFADPAATASAIQSGHSGDFADSLKSFGVHVGEWDHPTATEEENGFLAACNVDVPSGFVMGG
jgi:hypothetical protein